MCDHCGGEGVAIGFASHHYAPLFMQCTNCENRWHIQERSEYLWHVADGFVLRGKARVNGNANA